MKCLSMLVLLHLYGQKNHLGHLLSMQISIPSRDSNIGGLRGHLGVYV